MKTVAYIVITGILVFEITYIAAHAHRPVGLQDLLAWLEWVMTR